MTLTRTQAECLGLIVGAVERGEQPPTVREMQGALGLASTNNVHRILNCLEERGAIRRLKNRARAIEVLPSRHLLAAVSDAALMDEVERRGLRV